MRQQIVGVIRALLLATRRAGGGAWWWLRQVSGDAAYENYLRSTKRAPGGRAQAAHAAGTCSEREFYLDMLRRRYSGVSRCC